MTPLNITTDENIITINNNNNMQVNNFNTSCIEKEEDFQLTVKSCVSFVVSDEEDDTDDDEDDNESSLSLMDTSMEVDDDDDDDVDMQVIDLTTANDNDDLSTTVSDDQAHADTQIQIQTGTPATLAQESRRRRTVSFGSIYTREYSVTVGDHPCSTDSVGLTLDWGHAPEYAVPMESPFQQDWMAHVPVAFGEQVSFHSNNSSNSNSPPSRGRNITRLLAAERRKRICAVTGCLPSDVRAAEYNMALQRYNQELTDLAVQKNKAAAAASEDNDHETETEQSKADVARDAEHLSRRLRHHQHNLEVLYACFQDVQYRQEQEYSQYMQRHRQQQMGQHHHHHEQQYQQQRQEHQQQRQLRRSKRAAPEAAAV